MAHDEVETQALDLASGGGDAHDVETPFAWAEVEGEDEDVASILKTSHQSVS